MNLADLAEKIDRAIELEKALRDQKKELDGLKAELQTAAMTEFENKNIKYLQIFGSQGSCEAVYRQKFEIDNFNKLVSVIGDLVKDKVKRKEEVKFEVEPRFKKALIALVKRDYARHDLDELLAGMGLDAKQIKVAKKKLKGDYQSDRDVLATLGVTGEREEELDAIREAKNMELVERFFDPAAVNTDELQKCIFIDESLGIGLSYGDDEEDVA